MTITIGNSRHIKCASMKYKLALPFDSTHVYEQYNNNI